MLQGVPHAAAPRFASDPEAALPIVFEDDWLLVVDKPAGLLSVQGRELEDSVAARLAPASVVHRLDLDTSGLLVLAKDPATFAALQAAFARRAVGKQYIAILDGAVARDAGRVELALRVDLEDRPRQIHDPVHGKPAITEWRVVARDGDRTRVVLTPLTGRTHQLRVHAAHPLGIGAPIAGDGLYGRGGGRLLLHAAALAFDHPRTGVRLALESPPPF
jgi:tRNA pseudouridine32 synthase/23S rRNA pseudouridine746 synthase